MMPIELINVLDSQSGEQLLKVLAPDYYVLSIDGSVIFGADSFFAEVNRSFMSDHSFESLGWPSFEDNLWEFASQLASNKIVFYWKEADNFALADMKIFLLVVDILTSVARLLYNGENRKDFVVFLTGSHPSFHNRKM